MTKPTKQLLNASEAIALTINRLGVGVVSAYPITPQTKIVEKLAALEAEGQGAFEFVRVESEFAAASVVLGAAATGVRAYTATSSQGLLMMLEVLYNIAGLRLPVVLTCANRSVSAPLNIWNDHQDAMAARDAGWLMWFAENNQEAVAQHILAYKVAEKLKLPAMVNVDGFILTHMSEAVVIPTAAQIKQFLPALKPDPDNLLNIKNPKTLGHLVGPANFFQFRRRLNLDLAAAAQTINQEYKNYQKIFQPEPTNSLFDDGQVEYYGPAKAQTVLVALGSVVGTLKTAVDEANRRAIKKAAVLKIKTFRPWPAAAVARLLKGKRVIVINKAISPGALPPLSLEVAATLGNAKTDLTHVVAGLGGQDITTQHIIKLLNNKTNNNKIVFLE
jgi:pyruvate ferredoxin oxidoreductase alpha subunit